MIFDSPQRLSLKTNLKLAKLWLDRKEYTRLGDVSTSIIYSYRRAHSRPLNQLIRELHRSVEDGASGDPTDQSRGTLLLEIYALEIQMYNETRNFKKLKVCGHNSLAPEVYLTVVKEIYNATLEVRSAIPHPRIMGVIRECGGKMWMGESQFETFTSSYWRVLLSCSRAMGPRVH